MRTYNGIKTDIYENLIHEATEEHSNPHEWLKDMYEERLKEEVANDFEEQDLILALQENPEFLQYGARPYEVTMKERNMVFLTDVIQHLVWEEMVEEFYDEYLTE